MKINEVNQPSAKAIFESLRADTEQPFSEDTLMEISNNVAHSNFSREMTVEEFEAWIKDA